MGYYWNGNCYNIQIAHWVQNKNKNWMKFSHYVLFWSIDSQWYIYSCWFDLAGLNRVTQLQFANRKTAILKTNRWRNSRLVPMDCQQNGSYFRFGIAFSAYIRKVLKKALQFGKRWSYRRTLNKERYRKSIVPPEKPSAFRTGWFIIRKLRFPFAQSNYKRAKRDRAR